MVWQKDAAMWRLRALLHHAMHRPHWALRFFSFFESIWILPTATLLIVGGALAWFAYDDHTSVLEQEFHVLESNNRIAAAQISGVLRNVEQLLGHVAQEYETFHPEPQVTADTHLLEYVQMYPEIRSLVVTNEKGVVQYSAIRTLRGFDASQQDYFSAHLTQSLQPNGYASRHNTFTMAKNGSMALSMAMHDHAGRFKGVVVAGVNPQFLESALAQVVPEGEGAFSLVFDSRGEVVYQNPGSQQVQTNGLLKGLRVQNHGPGNALQIRRVGRFLAGDDARLVAIQRLDTGGLSVAVSKYAHPVFATWRRNVALRVAIFVLAFVVAVGLTRHIRHREKALNQLNAQLTADVAMRKQAESSLKLYASVFQNSTEAMVITDHNNTIVAVNPAFSRSTGYCLNEVRGNNPRILASGKTPLETYQALWAGLAGHGQWQGELWDKRKDGTIYPKWISIAVVRNALGDITHYLANFSDITERKNSERAMQNLANELQISHQNLRDLAAESEVRLESERKKIARDVHDELGQILAALRMEMSLVRMRWGVRDAELAEKMVGMKALVGRAMVGVRNVATHLRPMVLDAGLVPAVRWLCEGFSKSTAIGCVFTAHNDDVSVDEALAVVVFRIVQEALTNITRHAMASSVHVTIELWDSLLRLEVSDNGQGFDISEAAVGRSFGLLGMRERALAISGNVSITSTPGQGTVVVLTVPMVTEKRDKA